MREETEIEQQRPDACDICGATTDEVHCRVFCPNCGYTRDCSDP